LILKNNFLRIYPLTYPQRQLLAKGRRFLEEELHLAYSTFELNANEEFMNGYTDAMSNEHWVNMVRDNEKNYEWYTHWLIIDQKQNITVGGMGCTGVPDKNGQVMIGYFIDKKFEGNGYATEALKLWIGWMLQNKELKTIIADTLATGIASQKVLLKNGFVYDSETDEGLRWKFSI
jgi:ribosomal-protein-alanine N-acetyltransferase